ncbi:MAG: hypothetical protein GXP25_21000 [Planctomycetes bacterium]|nr:hypothetical protein [Planctomycetota bacterium]
MFGKNAKGLGEALPEALIVGELGVGVLVFTLGVALAIYFGAAAEQGRKRWAASLAFFRSPIFISVVLGLACSLLHFSTKSSWFSPVYRVLRVWGNSLEFLVALTIGLMLHPLPLRKLLPLILFVGGIKLLVQPLIAAGGAHLFGLPLLCTEVLVIQTAMPSATVAVVLAARYGCDSTVASALVVATTLMSVLTLPVVFFWAM